MPKISVCVAYFYFNIFVKKDCLAKFNLHISKKITSKGVCVFVFF